jgi:hypothetical protein
MQAGLGELLSVVLRRLPEAVRGRVALGGIFMTGGNTVYPGQAAAESEQHIMELAQASESVIL